MTGFPSQKRLRVWVTGPWDSEVARPPVAESVTRVGHGPSRDGEAARRPVAEAATSVGQGPPRGGEAARPPVAEAPTVVGQGPLVLCLSAAICVLHSDDLCR